MEKEINKISTAIGKMSREECLEFLEIYFNEKGLRNIIDYFTVGSMSDTYDTDQILECRNILKLIGIAKIKAKRRK